MEKVVRETCIKSGLQPEEGFILKVVQLEELLAVRHSVFIIGPAGAGKSKCWQTLAKAWISMGKRTTYWGSPYAALLAVCTL